MTDAPAAGAEEKVVEMLRTHWVKYLWPTFMYMILMSGGFLLLLVSGVMWHHNMWLSHAAFLVGLAIVTMIHHWFFHRLLSDYMSNIVITTRRIIYLEDSLLFRDDMHEIPLPWISVVNVNVHGLVQNLLNYGSLWFDTVGTSPEKAATTIALVPHPHRVARTINQLLKMK